MVDVPFLRFALAALVGWLDRHQQEALPINPEYLSKRRTSKDIYALGLEAATIVFCRSLLRPPYSKLFEGVDKLRLVEMLLTMPSSVSGS